MWAYIIYQGFIHICKQNPCHKSLMESETMALGDKVKMGVVVFHSVTEILKCKERLDHKE